MDLNLFQILSISLIVFLIFMIWFKYGISYLFNYIIGVVFIIFYDAICFNKDSIMFFVLNILFYNILFISSLGIKFIEKDYRAEKFFMFSKILFSTFLVIEICFIDPFEYFEIKFFESLLPIFIAYFPLHVLLYYKKYRNDE